MDYAAKQKMEREMAEQKARRVFADPKSASTQDILDTCDTHDVALLILIQRYAGKV